MLALLGISTLASLVASLVLGIRLLRLARRTGELPELLIGSAFLGAGVFGYVCMLIGTGGVEAMGAERAQTFFLVGYSAISGGVILTYLFVWRVFRPTSMAARIAVGIVCPIVAVTGLPLALPGLGEGGGAQLAGLQLVVFWTGHAVRIGCGVWGAVEAAHLFVSMRRRMRLGLADPLVTNRIMLWGISSTAGAVIFISTAVTNTGGSGMQEVMAPAQIILISTVALVSTVSQWLAFMPPKRYAAWVGLRATA